MARDWSFAPASFRGAQFYVESVSPSGGRRKAVHEYPGAETWDVEDLGTKVKKISGTAYFASDTSDADYATLIAACDQPGPGLLITPFFGAVQASAESWEPKWSVEKLNYCGVSVSFFIENPAGAPVPLGLGTQLMSAALAAASGIFGGAITAVFAGLPAISYQIADAGVALRQACDFVSTVCSSVALPDTVASPVQVSLASLAPTAAVAAETDPGAFMRSVLGALDSVAFEATPQTAAPVFQTAAALAVSLVPAPVTGQMEPAQAAATVPVALAAVATMQAIRLMAAVTYTDRPAAIAARTTIETMAAAVLPVLGALGPAATAAFIALWGQAVDQLTIVITNLAPVQLMKCNVALPSTVLAYQLYGDPGRATDLVARNKVSTPLMMPVLFEATAT